ncbi:hypothetical protein ACIA5C_23065 [Actinoplanes sp. NPDC051343]|uniref:hypothetical protein n=1 Tax=Actinoplanes sp. NPDC051343 TaxID=3363906 RepID=UPI0037BE0433
MPKWWFRPRAWFLIVSAATVLVALLLIWFLQHQGLDRADKWSSVLFGSIGAVAVTAGALTWLWRLGSPTAADRREASLSCLAAMQREQWTAEQAARRVRDPWPLNVRWVSTTRAQAVMASWASVRRSSGAGPVDVDGDYAGIAGVFDRADVPKRLIVLGEPGAGKSMLAIHLTLQLLERRPPGGPAAVLLSAAGWNPAQPLDDWIADQLVALDRRLDRRLSRGDANRRSLARDLVADGLVLPVLDGLDELDEQVQRAALIGISAAAAAGREFVVTCRTRPYEAAVAVCGPVPAAVVVELQSIPAAEAAQHLVDSAAMSDDRWSPIVAHLNRGGVTPLTEALGTPLMIWLARMVYQDAARDPGELLTAEWSTSRQGIEEHLLDHLIPAAWNRYPSAVAEDVEQWLSLIARHMRRHRVYDFAWWQISELNPAPVAQFLSVAFAVLVALVTIVAVFSRPEVFGLDANSAGAGQTSLFGGVWIGLLTAFGRLLFTDRQHPRQLTLRGLQTMFLAIGLPPFVIAALIGSPGVGGVLGLSAGTVVALGSGAVAAPIAAGPTFLLRVDRTAALVSGAVIGSATFLLFSGAAWPVTPLPWIAGLLAAAAAVLLSAWGQLHLAQVVVAVFHRTPLRQARALQQACERGILRRAGGVYQFRHGLLRDRISRR